MVEKQDSSRITKGKIDEAITALKDIKPKERSCISDREAVRKMRRYIEKLTSDKYGYSYDEVSEMLLGLGINLSGSRIKYLISELKKSSRRQKKTSSSDDNNPSSNPATETQLAVVNTASDQASSEPEESTVNSAKGKRKSKQTLSQQQQAESNL